MAVIKRKDANWESYLQQLAESGCKISDMERVEFAGFLLRRDMEGSNERESIFKKIIANDNYYIFDVIASYLIAESDDTNYDLTKAIKHIIAEHYNKEMDFLIKEEMKFLEEKRLQNLDNPNDEYDPNTNESLDNIVGIL